jgi:UDP-N-acetylglucosamine acyltransferase
VNIATAKAGRVTVVGSDCYFMSYIHIGHDCHIGNHVIIANNTQLGGHVEIGDFVVIGAVCAFNQFTRVGKFAFIAGDSVANKDILPFSKAQGRYATCRATNKVGLQRRGVSEQEVQNIHRAVRIFIMGSDTVEDAIARIQNECEPSDNIDYMLKFVRESNRGMAR